MGLSHISALVNRLEIERAGIVNRAEETADLKTLLWLNPRSLCCQECCLFFSYLPMRKFEFHLCLMWWLLILVRLNVFL